MFNGLLNTEVNLLNNSIVKIYKNGFNGTKLKTIKLSINKLTIEDVCSLKESLKPVIIIREKPLSEGNFL